MIAMIPNSICHMRTDVGVSLNINKEPAAIPPRDRLFLHRQLIHLHFFFIGTTLTRPDLDLRSSSVPMYVSRNFNNSPQGGVELQRSGKRRKHVFVNANKLLFAHRPFVVLPTNQGAVCPGGLKNITIVVSHFIHFVHGLLFHVQSHVVQK